jgi:hypothetical protein
LHTVHTHLYTPSPVPHLWRQTAIDYVILMVRRQTSVFRHVLSWWTHGWPHFMTLIPVSCRPISNAWLYLVYEMKVNEQYLIYLLKHVGFQKLFVWISQTLIFINQGSWPYAERLCWLNAALCREWLIFLKLILNEKTKAQPNKH